MLILADKLMRYTHAAKPPDWSRRGVGTNDADGRCVLFGSITR
jgi:hypothetical protein